MTKPLGPTFGAECIAAGLGGLPFSWGATSDDITGRGNLSADQNKQLDAVIAAHDPTKTVNVAPAPPYTSTLNMGGTIREVIGED